jgi:hypothetical protein
VIGLIAPSLRGYRPAWARRDLVAGATVWAVLVPESLAYATIAGVLPVVELVATLRERRPDTEQEARRWMTRSVRSCRSPSAWP